MTIQISRNNIEKIADLINSISVISNYHSS